MERENKEEVKAFTPTVKLKNWLLQEEQFQDLKSLTLADLYYRRIPKARKNKIKKVYEELFSSDLISDLLMHVHGKMNYMRAHHKQTEISDK